ncbi:MAG: hypothetical protein IKH57_08520 [Clostridia bacterium]|nr:hypothetical protein [Clostridia bacterium]
MSANAMLSLTATLNIQPGEIPPTIHLKQDSNSMDILLHIATKSEAQMETGGTAILKGIKPDSSELFIVLPIASMDTQYIDVELTSDEIGQMTDVAGKYRCTISIIDSENVISQSDYEDYDLITVQPFIAEVEKSAAE